MCSADVPLPLPKPARHPLNTFPNNLRHPTLHSRVYFQGTQSKTWKHYKILCVTLPLPHHRPHIHTHEHTSTCTSMYTQQTFTCMYIVMFMVIEAHLIQGILAIPFSSSILVNDIITHPGIQNKTLGSSLTLLLLSRFSSVQLCATP